MTICLLDFDVLLWKLSGGDTGGKSQEDKSISVIHPFGFTVNIKGM